MNANQRQFSYLIGKARRTGEQQEIVVGSDTFTIKVTQANRKCYDFEPTPTATIYLNGRRIPRQAAMVLLN